MGLGGNLIWTRILAGLNAVDRRPPTVCHKPLLSDLVAGRLYDGAVSLKEDPVFRGNPHLAFTEARPKARAWRLLDKAFQMALHSEPLKKAYERRIFRSSEARAKAGGPRLVHVDMLIHSYAEGQRNRRMIWKQGGDAAAVIARNFSLGLPLPDCQLYFGPGEQHSVAALMREAGLDRPFVVVEPHTNREWFGDLRAWPFDRWQATVHRIRSDRPGTPIVQVGVADSPPLHGVIYLCGRTTFREAALLIQRSTLYVGTEGGLMHAANAVGARAVIIWGGVTLPEFAGYPDRHRILRKEVPCAPCGNLGWCDRGRACIDGVTTDEVVQAVSDALDDQDLGREAAL